MPFFDENAPLPGHAQPMYPTSTAGRIPLSASTNRKPNIKHHRSASLLSAGPVRGVRPRSALAIYGLSDRIPEDGDTTFSLDQNMWQGDEGEKKVDKSAKDVGMRMTRFEKGFGQFKGTFQGWTDRVVALEQKMNEVQTDVSVLFASDRPVAQIPEPVFPGAKHHNQEKALPPFPSSPAISKLRDFDPSSPPVPALRARRAKEAALKRLSKGPAMAMEVWQMSRLGREVAFGVEEAAGEGESDKSEVGEMGGMADLIIFGDENEGAEGIRALNSASVDGTGKEDATPTPSPVKQPVEQVSHPAIVGHSLASPPCPVTTDVENVDPSHARPEVRRGDPDLPVPAVDDAADGVQINLEPQQLVRAAHFDFASPAKTVAIDHNESAVELSVLSIETAGPTGSGNMPVHSAPSSAGKEALAQLHSETATHPDVNAGDISVPNETSAHRVQSRLTEHDVQIKTLMNRVDELEAALVNTAHPAPSTFDETLLAMYTSAVARRDTCKKELLEARYRVQDLEQRVKAGPIGSRGIAMALLAMLAVVAPALLRYTGGCVVLTA